MANYFWSECSSPDAGCGGVNLGGSGPPSSPNGYRQDYSVPLKRGTPVQSPVNGVILPEHHSGYLSLLGRQKWGGETDILTMLPEYSSKPVVLTLIHYDTIDANAQGGAVVKYGDVLGTSGGQNDGSGNWPADPSDSTGPHMGIAVRPYDRWNGYYDPTFLVNDLLGGANPSAVPSSDQLNSFGIKTHIYVAGGQARIDKPSFSNPLDAIGAIFTFISDPDHWLRLGKIIAGSLLLGIGILATIFGPALPDIAAAGVTAAGVPEAAGPVQQTLRGGRRRTIRAGIRTAGAIQGQKTLARRQAAGVTQEQARAGGERRRAAAEGQETKKRERAAGIPPRRIINPARQEFERAQTAPPGEPVYAPGTRGRRHLIGYKQPGSEEITKEPRPPRNRQTAVRRQSRQELAALRERNKPGFERIDEQMRKLRERQE